MSAGEDPESGLLRVWYFATLECIDFGCAGGVCPFGRCSGKPPANCSAEPEHVSWGSTNISGAMLYAESRDGVSFHKPELGLVSVKGSNKNNVVLDLGAKGDGFSVLRDDRDTADRRWKLISGSCAVAGCEGARLAVSRDGLHWTGWTSLSASAGGEWDTFPSAVFDPARSVYVAMNRFVNPTPKGPKRRIVVGSTHTLSDDWLGAWTPTANMSGRGLNSSQWHEPDQIVAHPYEGRWIAFANVFRLRPAPDYLPDGFYKELIDMELATTADLENWSYVKPGAHLIPRGPSGSKDCCEIFGAGGQILVRGDELLIFYVGGNGPFEGKCSSSLCVFFRGGIIELLHRCSRHVAQRCHPPARWLGGIPPVAGREDRDDRHRQPHRVAAAAAGVGGR